MIFDTAVLPVAVTSVLTAAGFAQSVAGQLAVHRFFAQACAVRAQDRPPITILKPLHGDEPMLEAALATFCRQDYPRFQIVFGVQCADDAAIAVVQRLQLRFPHVDMELVVDPTPHGSNRKIANLINMFPSARHDVLVISDSDMHAASDYLDAVVSALAMPDTGLVTTLYTGLPVRPGIVGALGAAYINQSFAAGAVMARSLGRQDCMGATMAVTRETLMRVGGLPALAPYVADDAVFGQKIRALGQSVSLAATVPSTTVAEQSLVALFQHELRWARTIRAVAPLGFAVSAIQFPVFWALMTAAFAGGAVWSLFFVAAAIGLRAATGRAVERDLGAAPTPLWVSAVRDPLSMLVLLTAYMGDEVAWRGHVLNTGEDTSHFEARPILAPRRG